MTLMVCLFGVLAASWAVPRAVRRDWRRWWMSEIWHFTALLRGRGVKRRHVAARIRHHSTAALRDAWRLRVATPGSRRLLLAMSKPQFCLGTIAFGLAMIVLASHSLAITRAMLAPDYPDARQLVLISETGLLPGERYPVDPALLEYWKARCQTLTTLAGYTWNKPGTAWVTPNFFEVLGARPRRFLLHSIHEWRRATGEEPLGLVGRLKPGVNFADAQTELRDLAARFRHYQRPYPPRDALVIPLVGRIRQPLFAYAGVCSVTTLILLFGALIGMRADLRRIGRIRRNYWAYYCAKAVTLPLGLALFIWECSRATSFTVTGGATFVAEPFFVWLVILASGAIVWWCLADQRGRCRACVRTLQYPVRIGSLGAVLFDHAGTELVCCEGHGSLYVPAVSSDYVQRGGWTALDSSDVHSEPVPR